MSKTAIILLAFSLFGCSQSFDPKHTFTPTQLHEDYAIMRQALVEAHPGIYRYTSPDSMRLIFDKTEKQLDHDMTQREFRRVTSPVFSLLRCGHTDIYSSSGYLKYIKKHPPKDLPIGVDFLEQKIRVTKNRSTDSTVRIGNEVLQINDQPIAEIIAQMRELIASDGYNQTFKNTLINQNFDGYYRFLYGETDSLKVMLKDSVDKISLLNIKLKKPLKAVIKKDSVSKTTKPVAKKVSKSDLKRTLTFSTKDSSLAILDINTFSDDSYRSFYKKAFKKIAEKGSKNLVIDVRNNGGGASAASTKLMSYLLDSNFVVYDTVYSPLTKKPSFNKYYTWKFVRFISRTFFSIKLPNGGMLQGTSGDVEKPTKKYHFDGNTYILTNGGSFSAASIFPSIAQLNDKTVKVIGRETGGGRHGCNAFISPYVVLPNTKTRVRLPMYKLLLHVPGKDIGRGVMPDYPVDYTFKAAMAGQDLDMEKVYELIKK